MKRSVWWGLLFSSAALLLMQRRAKAQAATPGRKRSTREGNEKHQVAEQLTRRYITYGIFPAWTLAGFLDYIWHRQTKIQTTSGTEESVTHLLMMAEAGLPIVLALFLEINAGVLLMIIAGWVLHELTVYWDLKYTSPRRVIYPREQMTHVFMQSLPFDILAVLACLHPEQFKALFGVGEDKPRFGLRLKQPGMPHSQALIILGLMGALIWIPYLEEFLRCFRASQKGLTESETPECARQLFVSDGTIFNKEQVPLRSGEQAL